MSRGPLQHKLLVINPLGFHLRPMTAFAERAQAFQSDVLVTKDGGPTVNGKSPWELMALVAEQGSKLTLEISGPDAEAALQALLDVLVSFAVVNPPTPPPKG